MRILQTRTESNSMQFSQQRGTWGSKLCSSCRVEWLALGSRQQGWEQQAPWQPGAVPKRDRELLSQWE